MRQGETVGERERIQRERDYSLMCLNPKCS